MTRAELRAFVAQVQQARPEAKIELWPRLTTRQGLYHTPSFRVDITIPVVHSLYFDRNWTEAAVVERIDEEVTDLIEETSQDAREDTRAHLMVERNRMRVPVTARLPEARPPSPSQPPLGPPPAHPALSLWDHLDASVP